MIPLLLLRRLHRWVAVVVALQVLLWCVSGTVFAWLDHHAVAGEQLVREVASPPIRAGSIESDPRAWLSGMVFHEARLQPLDGAWVYRVERPDGVRLFDARQGTPVTVDATIVRGAAAARYAGDGRITAVNYHAADTLEARGHGAVWSVRYDDAVGTTLWFSADDASLVAARSTTWRVFDFFWMLHTMDYRGRDDFNHPLVILFASAALWVALTGALLVVRVLRPKTRAG